MDVLKMKSATNEVIPFVKRVSTSKARGQVDKWLLDLEGQMKESMKKQIFLALERYEVNFED